MTMLTGKPFVEMGANAYLELQKEKYLRRVKRQIQEWGYELVKMEPTALGTKEAVNQ